MKLEQKLGIYVGAGGSQISGSKKQPIAIERAILQNSQIPVLCARRIEQHTRQKDSHWYFLTRDMEFFDNSKHKPRELSSVPTKDCLTLNTIVSTSYSALISGVSLSRGVSVGCSTVSGAIVLPPYPTSTRCPGHDSEH